MSILLPFNGQNYIIPTTGEIGWGSNLDDYLVAIAAGALQKSGGSFTLSAEVDFGASYGLKSLYYKSRSTNPATSGPIRLANLDEINWRNFTNTGNLPLTANTSNQLIFNGFPVFTASVAGALLLPINLAATPSLAFIGDTSTGIYSSGAGNISLSIAGSQKFNFAGSSFLPVGTISLGSNTSYWSQVFAASGSAANPTYTFGGDADTGMYRTGDNAIGFSVAGALVTGIDSGGALNLTPPVSDDTDVIAERIYGSGNAITLFKTYSTTGLTTAKQIAVVSQYCNLILVTGDSGSSVFADLIFTGYATATVNVISSSGVATVRTYSKSASSSTLNLALASDTWDVTTISIELRNR